MKTRHTLVLSACVGTLLWWSFSGKSTALPRIVQDVAPPTPAPMLAQVLDSPEVRRLQARVESVREQIAAPAHEFAGIAVEQDASPFEQHYARTARSCVLGLVIAPHFVEADRLVRDIGLNPNDVPLPPEEVALLHRVVEGHRELARVVSDARGAKAHEVALRCLRDEGLVPVDEIIARLPSEQLRLIRESVGSKWRQGSDEYARALADARLMAARKAYGSHVSTNHAGREYLLPSSEVRQHLSGYDQAMRTRGLLMASDVLAVFARNGALDGEQLQHLLGALERAATSTTMLGG